MAEHRPSKVASLVPALKPDADVVNACRHLLRMAETGALRAVAAAIETTGGHMSRALAAAEHWNATALYFELAMLQRQIADQSEASRSPPDDAPEGA